MHTPDDQLAQRTVDYRITVPSLLLTQIFFSLSFLFKSLRRKIYVAEEALFAFVSTEISCEEQGTQNVEGAYYCKGYVD